MTNWWPAVIGNTRVSQSFSGNYASAARNASSPPELMKHCYTQICKRCKASVIRPIFSCTDSDLKSEFLRELRKRCQKCQQSAGVDEALLHADLQKVQSIGYPANFFLHGFFCPPDGVLPDAPPLKLGEVHRLTGSFPKPWQLLTKEEREYRAFIPPHGIVDFVQIVPFQRGIFLDA